MKDIIKKILAEIMYRTYRSNIFKNNIKVNSVDETIRELQTTNKSMVRFGDGEILIIEGKNLKLQKADAELTEGLKRIIGFQQEGLIVTIPEIFEDLSMYNKASQLFWKEHLLFFRKTYNKYCNKKRKYYSTSVSRFYYAMEDKRKCDVWIEEIKKIWKDKKIVVVEGRRTHNGVGNDLLDEALSVDRIIGPAKDAYKKIDEIYECCMKYSKDYLFLVSLGATAKLLVEKLFLEGYRAIDIGNLDMEYEWYLQKDVNKVKIAKHDVESDRDNELAGYGEYLKQIKYCIESDTK